MQDDRLVGLLEQVPVDVQVVAGGLGAGGQRAAGHQDDPRAGVLDRLELLLIGLR